MKRISKQVRNEAIEICLEIADECERTDTNISFRTGGYSIGCTFEPAHCPVSLGLAAWASAFAEIDTWGNGSCLYLEAAALLRDGWSPGDPVVRLPPEAPRAGGRSR